MALGEDPGGWEGADPFAGPDIMAALSRWAAEAQVDEAAEARAREQWMRRQAAEATTFASVLSDLADRRRDVLVQLATGRRHRGLIRVLGADFIGLRTETGADVLVALDAVTSVRSGPGDGEAWSGRAVTLRLRLAGAIAAMAEERPRVTVGTVADTPVNGDLRAVGTDVVTVRVDGDTRANVYVPITAITEMAIALG